MANKFVFNNSSGEELVGILDLPEQTPPIAVALFAHCFSCGKNVLAASRISRELKERGFAVLRFDFTGLGESDGEFGDTNFSTNVDDLRLAIDALRERDMTPEILIGHSLGGAAVLFLAEEIPEVKLVATIGAPSEPRHVLHVFSDSKMADLEAHGEAEISLGGRPFTIKKQFIDDVNETSLLQRLERNSKPLLICHSPTDEVVNIKHAQRIYQAASHPKSFVSLDGANHLLTDRSDSDFVASVVTSWANRYIDTDMENEVSLGIAAVPIANKHGGVTVLERDKKFTQDIIAGEHRIVADEPIAVGGKDLGMTPYDLLLAALGTCTSMTLRMYAERKGIELNEVEVRLEHDRIHASDCVQCEDQPGKVDRIRRMIRLDGDITNAQKKRMLEIAEKCPVHRTLHNQKEITSELMTDKDST